MLGKRKREVAVVARPRYGNSEDERPSSSRDDVGADIFRKYFESAFEPLPEQDTTATPSLLEDEEADEDEDEDSDVPEEDLAWEGLSDAGEETASVEVIEHRALVDVGDGVDILRPQYKTFMSAKPPKEVQQRAIKKSGTGEDEDDSSEALNLKHDLDLQRLLNESHLLEQAKSASTPGSHRHKALDMRMQSLGSKDSLFHQEKMPLSHRKGILAKATSRDAMRRKEAKENGIVLEKPSGKVRSATRRERGVDAPAVGKFRGGTLKLSKKDVLDIQGSGRSRGGGKKGRR
ncbi:hypothetical protein EDD37DRAFT_646630 [Exophiala viscosa]|uniref:uncharacterized protein n=1 Tax=Exophiala viscosa TaxID=2486360 RepID=UPI00219F9973|nr:hypothetical protein EDD37DRAFT_646630 [Exophiala viscosa]